LSGLVELAAGTRGGKKRHHRERRKGDATGLTGANRSLTIEVIHRKGPIGVVTLLSSQDQERIEKLWSSHGEKLSVKKGQSTKGLSSPEKLLLWIGKIKKLFCDLVFLCFSNP